MNPNVSLALPQQPPSFFSYQTLIIGIIYYKIERPFLYIAIYKSYKNLYYII